jgi:hypothetical protein
MGRQATPNLGRTLVERFKTIARFSGFKADERRAAFERMRQAIRDVLPRWQRDGSDVGPALVAELIAYAEGLLREHETAEDDRAGAAQTRKLLALACRRLMRTYEADRAGPDVWWEDEDLERGDAILRGCVSNADIGGLVAEARSKSVSVNGEQMRAALAVGWMAAAKDALRIGKVRVASVEGALSWSGLPSRRSLVAIVLRMLGRLGVVECLDERYGPRFARRYAVAGRSFNLPFVVAAVGDQRRQAETAMAARSIEHNGDAHAEILDLVNLLVRSPFRRLDKPPRHYTHQCLATSSFLRDLEDWPRGLDDGYWASLADLGAEIQHQTAPPPVGQCAPAWPFTIPPL